MVGSVQNTGSTAYLKGSQLGSSSNRATSTRTTDEPELRRETREAERAEAPRSTDSTSSIVKASASTELSDRNEQRTIDTEQTRGSLLDIAV